MTKPFAMRDALLTNILNAMHSNSELYFVTADFGSPVLDLIRREYPERFTNVGVAEQNLINVSAGLSLEGFTVFAYAIAPFITMRCFEQLRVNLSLMSEVRPLNVNLVGVGAGYSYVVSGPTHQCYEDIGIMRNLPNFRIYSASDDLVAGALVNLCIKENGPKYLRLDAQVLPQLRKQISDSALEDGFEVLRKGQTGAIISTGFMSHVALKVAKKFNLSVIDFFDLTGADTKKLLQYCDQFRVIFSLEEGFIGRGGIDAIFSNLLRNHGTTQVFVPIGVDPSYRFDLGTREELHELAGIGIKAVSRRIESALSNV
ncbi:MAG: transketolase [Flavobacteriaceae bacterium]|nr:transketolase [Flavobacteriaceae bacterium]|tara:strand:+ start:778 stop:1722 length:945 start_codon:yes stop_codon:yes gene_type:complete